MANTPTKVATLETTWPTGDPYDGLLQKIDQEWKDGTGQSSFWGMIIHRFLHIEKISGVYVAEYSEANFGGPESAESLPCSCEGNIQRSWLMDSQGFRLAAIPEPYPTYSSIWTPFPLIRFHWSTTQQRGVMEIFKGGMNMSCYIFTMEKDHALQYQFMWMT